MERVLKINKLTKKFGRLCAVNELELEVMKGQVFGILGPNGSGKTTTLGMLMGVILPTSGDYSWMGEPPTHTIRRKIGAVLEHPIFYPYLSGQKNLELMAIIKQAPVENIPKVLDLVGLTDRKEDKYKNYSLGMKQRLAIATALVNDPIVLILDEPTNGLDPMGIAQIRDIIKKIALSGKTIILASHLLDEVEKICTHFAILMKGNKVYDGAMGDISRSEEVVTITAPQENVGTYLEKFKGTISVQKDDHNYLVKLKPGFSSDELNRFLVENGVFVSQLSTKKKSLEKQFLEILAENK